MYKNRKNQVGDLNGNNNQVIQIILSGGDKVVEKLGVLVDRLVEKEKQEIVSLKELIAAKEELLHDKRKVLEVQGGEIIRLKSELSEKQKLLEESEERFTKIYIENDGKDYSGSQELYPRALELLTKGDKGEALKILERHKLLEQKKQLDQESSQQSSAWLLRADLLKDEDNWGEELNECFDCATELSPNWSNNLISANHFRFVGNFDKAKTYYQICLQKALTDYETAVTLNDLGNLQSDKNEYDQAEQSYQEALETYRELASVNPQTYLPDVGMTLNNLGILQRAKNEYGQAEKSYQEALKIRRKLASVNPQVYEISLADTYMSLSQLYRFDLVDTDKSKGYAQIAYELYWKYWEFIPHAQKWGNIAKENME